MRYWIITGCWLLTAHSASGQFYQPPSVFVMHQTERAVYIGGIFQSIGGVRAANIAQWTPNRFEPLGEGVSFLVNKLAVDRKNRLYAGGYQTADNARKLARWDGVAWEDIRLPDSLRAILGLLVDPWGYVCVMSSVRDSVERPVLWRSNGGEWSCLTMPTESANQVHSIAMCGPDIVFAQGASIWRFDGKCFAVIDGPNPRSGAGQGLTGSLQPYVFCLGDSLYEAGTDNVRRWDNGQWKGGSALPTMNGGFMRIEALATTRNEVILVRSYWRHEIDIGWDVRQVDRWSDGQWSYSDFPYYCTSMAILGAYLLTGHVSDEMQPMISVRKISDVPWLTPK